MNKALAAIIFVVTSAPSWAQMTPEGLWRNVDDKTGEAKAEIRIQANGAGVLNGTIEKRLTKDAKPEDVCKECDDDRKDKPLLGLEIIRGCRGLNLVGGDLVEVSPPFDTTGNTALIGANFLFEMLCVLPGVEYG